MVKRSAHSPPLGRPAAQPTQSHYHLTLIGIWSINDILANQAAAVRGATIGDPTGSTNNARTVLITRPGYIREISVVLSAAETAGSVRFRPFINGVDQTGANNENSVAISTATDNAYVTGLGVKLSPGDLVEPRYTSDAAWLPVTSDARVYMWASFAEYP
jgi:hypothetical protein